MVFVTGEEAVKTLIHTRSAEFPKGRLQNQVLDPLFGNAMISSEGADWKWQRGAAAPLFRHEELLRYGPIMTAAAEGMVGIWQNERGGRRAIHRDMLRTAFGVISRTMLAGGADDVIAAIEKGHADYFRYVNWWVANRLLRLPAWLPRPGGSTMRRQEANIRDAVRKLVESRTDDAAAGDDLLGRLLAATDPETGRQMGVKRLVNNIIAFLVAGYDTTALALSWSLYLIAKSPRWQQAIRDEAQAVAGDGPIGSEHFDKLTVTRQVLNEALRLYPTAPIVIRDIVEDIELEGVKLRAGTIGVIPIYAIHRHRSYWRDPDSFDPSRFGPDQPKPSRYRFLPFGAGPRICLGASFAMLEATILLATFVRAARFEPVSGVEPEPTGQMFLTARNGIELDVTMVD